MARDDKAPATPTATTPAAQQDGARTITLTLDELRALTQPTAPAPVAGPRAATPDESFEGYTSWREGMRKADRAVWFLACRSDVTNARFVAEVNESRSFHAGRVITLHGYEYPPGSDTSTASGGLCPLGTMLNKDGQQVPDYKQWLYEFRKADLQHYAGADGKRLDTLGPARATLAEALADLAEAPPTPPAPGVVPFVPEIKPREATAP